jgi:hypothetical protein
MDNSTRSEAMRVDLPARDHPPSEEALSTWFRERFGRDPTELELGILIGAMIQREAARPQGEADCPSDAWIIGPSNTPPAHD